MRSIIVALLLVPVVARAQDEFVIRKGRDTVAVERFTRDGATLTGHIAQTVGLATEYVVTLRPDASVEHVEMSRKGRQGNGVVISLDLADRYVQATMTTGVDADTMRFETSVRPLPFLAVSFALTEQIVRASRLALGQSARWTAVRLGAADTATVTVTRFHADSAALTMADLELRVAVARNGDVIGGTHMGQKWTVERKK